MFHRPIYLLIACTLVTACAAEGDDADCSDGKCDVDQSCSDPKYGDGMCQTDLSCAVPDIDCFRTFDTDEAAAAWFADLETTVAQGEGRPARAVIPAANDARFPKMRALLDKGWETMRKQVPVGKLADARPGLVFIEDPTVNAFVMPETLDKQRASFVVMIHSALLETPTSDDATLGLVMHELEHAVGLHVVAGVPERIQQFYFASDDDEPIGADQKDNADVREAVTLWRGLAVEIGPFTNTELAGLPLGGFTQRMLKTVLAAGAQTNPTVCAQAKDQLNGIFIDITNGLDPISSAPHVDASYTTRINAAFAETRDKCLATFTASFVDVAAELAGVTPEMVEAELTAEDKALVTGKHVIDAIAAVVTDRRTKMRTIESAVETQLGSPWTAIRFYSEEENADDTSVVVLRGAGLQPTGLGTFFLDVLMSKPQADACNAVLATYAVPHYGVDLLDTHHSNCWRVYHQTAFADHTARARRFAPLRGQVTPVRSPMPFAMPKTYAMY
jgi:hypothetical protein